jgi:hypothetical protein
MAAPRPHDPMYLFFPAANHDVIPLWYSPADIAASFLFISNLDAQAR